MGLTRIQASQISNIDYKQSVRVVATSNITLAGGAPATVDNVALSANDRVLVTGQSTGSQNGIYYVQTVGIGNNGTWVRTDDANATGEIEAGMIVMATEGANYADTQWKLTTNDPITVGSTSLTFVQNYSTSSISSGSSNVAVVANGNVTISSAGTPNVLVVTSSGANIAGTVSASGNITGSYVLGNGAFLSGVITSVANINNGTSNVTVVSSGGNVTVGVGGTSNVVVFATTGEYVTGVVSASGNITGGNVSTGGLISATGNINTAGTVNINSTQGNYNVLNISGTALAPYGTPQTWKFFTNNTALGGAASFILFPDSSTQTTAYPGTSSTLSLTGNVTGGNLLTSGLLSATGTVTGSSLIGSVVTATANITGGNILTGGLISATGNITGGNLITGGLLTATGNINTSAGVVATGNVTGGNINTAGLITATGNATVGNITATIGTFTTFTSAQGGNVTGTLVATSANAQFINQTNPSGYLTVAGYATITGNVTGGNILTAGLISATGNITGGNVSATNHTGTAVSVTGNITGGNLSTSGLISATGNITGGNISATTHTGTTVSVTGNVTGGNILTAGLISATGNITGGNVIATNLTGTLLTAAQTNITSLGTLSSLTVTGASNYTGNVNVTGNINVTGNLNYANVTDLVVGDPLIYVGANNTANVWDLGMVVAWNDGTYQHGGWVRDASDGIWKLFGNVVAEPTTTVDFTNAIYQPMRAGAITATTGVYSSTLSATGNITGGNIVTSGLVTVTGNINSSAGVLATGNVTGGNVVTAGIMSSTGNATHGNIITAGVITATGTITTAGSLNSTGFAVGNGAVSNVGLGFFPTAGTRGDYAIRDYSTVFTTMYLDVGMGGSAGGEFQFRSSNAFSLLMRANSTGVYSSGVMSATGAVSGLELTSTQSSGDEGGQLNLAKAATNTTLAGNVIVDVFQNRFRIFENGGTSRGAYIDLTSASAGVGTNLLAGAGGTPGGSNTYVQFNDGGAFGGNGQFVYDKVTNTLTAGIIAANNNGNGTNFKVGDDVYIGDVNTADTMSIRGQQNAANGWIVFGNVDTTGKLGRAGSGPLSYTGAFSATGNITGGNLSGTSIVGTLTTAAQTNITSVGTLGSLAVTGNITSGNISGTTGAFTSVSGTLTTAAQTNITSVGTLGSLAVTGNITSGNLSGTSIVGTLTTAAQTNITSVGTLGSLSVTGNITGGNITTAGNLAIPTATANTNTTQAATTAFVVRQAGGLSPVTIGTAAVGTSLKYAREDHTHGGVGSAVAGTGISVSAATGAVTITNSGVTSAVAGTGIGVSGATGAVTITNSGVTSIVAGTNISVSGATGAVTVNVSGTVANANNSAYLNSISAVNLYNNMGQAHSTRTAFDATTPSYDFGYRFVQGSTNGPGTGGSQFYSWYIGLGSDYPATGAGSYGAMFAVDRNVSTPYLSVRYNESNSFGAWRKIYAGYADTAGTAGTVTTAAQGNITSVGTLSSLSVTGNITSSTGHVGTMYTNSIINTGANATGNIGSSSLYFNTVFAKATSAQYADVAENYLADADYIIGTVLEFGGNTEVTISTESHSSAIAGTVSDKPAYIMNSGLTGEHVTTVALLGRVPCRVVGKIRKGNLLVSSHLPGVATALDITKWQPGCVIGKALESYDSDQPGVIEVVIGKQ